MTKGRAQLQQGLEDAHPVSEKNFFDLLVSKSAFDQLGSDISRVTMMQEIRNKMDMREFFMKGSALFFGPAPVDKLEKIKANAHTIDPDQIDYMLNVINVTFERGFFFL